MYRKILPLTLLLLAVLWQANYGSESTIIKYLSGTDKDHTVEWDFFCTRGMRSGEWTTIPVPSCWELQGFGKYNYGRDKISERGMEKGLYRYSFEVPGDWKGKQLTIVFEGSMTDTEVKINGKSAGEIHQATNGHIHLFPGRTGSYALDAQLADKLLAAAFEHFGNAIQDLATQVGTGIRPGCLRAARGDHGVTKILAAAAADVGNDVATLVFQAVVPRRLGPRKLAADINLVGLGYGETFFAGFRRCCHVYASSFT